MIYEGQLDLTFEQGCGHWVQFHDDRGLHGPNNEYWDWNWTINFSKNTKIENIKILDEVNSVMYEGPLTFSRGRYVDQTHYPNEMDYKEWVIYAQNRYRCVIKTGEIVDALKKSVVL